MARCRILDFCERYKIDNGIYVDKSKRILPRTVKERNKCVRIHKNHYCVFWKENRKDSSLNGVEEIARNFENAKYKINENHSKRRIRYRFPKHETIDQLQKVFVFDLQTHIDQQFAEANAAGFFDVNRLRD